MSSRFNQPPTERDQRLSYPDPIATDFNGRPPPGNYAPGNSWAAVAAAAAHVPQTFRAPQAGGTTPPNLRLTHVPTHVSHQPPPPPSCITIKAAHPRNNASGHDWAAMAAASAHAPPQFRVPQVGSTIDPRFGPPNDPTRADRPRPLSPNSIAIKAALANGTLISTRIRADRRPRVAPSHKRKAPYLSQTMPEDTRRKGARPRPSTTPTLPTSGANNPSRTKETEQANNTHRVTFASHTKLRAPPGRTHPGNLARPPSIQPQLQTAEPNATASGQLSAPHIFHNIYPLETYKQRSQHPPPPRHAPNEKSSTTRQERKTHTQQLAQPTQSSLCNNGICKAPVCNCNPPTGGWGKSKHTQPPPTPPPPPAHSPAQSVRLIVTLPFEPPSVFYVEQSLPASTHDIIRSIWREAPGQFLRVITRITFTSSEPPPIHPIRFTSYEHPHCTTIKPGTPAAHKPLALNPLATHFVLVELAPLPSTSTTDQQTTSTDPPESPVYSPERAKHPIKSPTYSPPAVQPTEPTPENQPTPMQLDPYPHPTEPMDTSTLIDVTDEPPENNGQQIYNDAELCDYHEEPCGASAPHSPEPTAGTTPSDPPKQTSLPLPPPAPHATLAPDGTFHNLYHNLQTASPPLRTQTISDELLAPYLASEPTTPSSQSPHPPIVPEATLCPAGYTHPPSTWTTLSQLMLLSTGTEVAYHWANGLRTLTAAQHVLASSGQSLPQSHCPLPFYKHVRFCAQAPTPAFRRTNASKHGKNTTTTPQTDPRTHPYKHYETRISSKSQHIPPKLPEFRMILTNWAYALVALFHCSLPPYVLPDCMKWLLTTTKKNHGFQLSANGLLSSAPALIAQHTHSTTTASPNSTWDLPTPEPFMKLARAYLTKIGEAPTDATRHAIISHEAVIEQWLHVGLYLYPIETIAQQLWTVAYSYALHILTHHPGQHFYDDHPTTSLDVLDEDYFETHPFTVKFNHALHPIPRTHPRPEATTPMRFEGLTTSALFRRFRNLMRLRGILCSVLFIVRTHLSAIRRRAYTNLFTDALHRDLLQALPCISTAIITTILHLNTHHTAIQLFTTYPAPYKNPVDRTTLKISPDLSSNICQGDPLAHLLHNTYHYDHRQFTISPQLQDSPPPHRGYTTTPQQDDSAHLTALYADLLQPPYIHPTETPSPANPTAHYANLQQLPYLPPMLSPFYLQLPDLRSNDFSSEDLPLRNHSTTIRSPPQSQATTEEMTDSEEESSPPPLTSSAFWALAGSYQDLLNTFNTIDTVPLSVLRNSPLRITPPPSETDSMPSLESESAAYPDNPPPLVWHNHQLAPPHSALRTRGGGPNNPLAAPPRHEPSPDACHVCFLNDTTLGCYLDTRQPEEPIHPSQIVPACQACFDIFNPPPEEAPSRPKRDIQASQSSDTSETLHNFFTCTVCHHHYPEQIPPSTDPRCPSCISSGYIDHSQIPHEAFNPHATLPPNIHTCSLCNRPFMNRYQGPMPVCHACIARGFAPPPTSANPHLPQPQHLLPAHPPSHLQNLPPPSIHPEPPPPGYQLHLPPPNLPPNPHQPHTTPPLQHPPQQRITHQQPALQSPIPQGCPPPHQPHSQWISPDIHQPHHLQHELAAVRAESAAKNHELASLRQLLARRTPPSPPGSAISESRTDTTHTPYTNLSSIDPHYLSSYPPSNHDQHHQPQITYAQSPLPLQTRPPASELHQTYQQQITYDHPPQPPSPQLLQLRPTLEETQLQQLAELHQQHRLQLAQQQQEAKTQRPSPHTQPPIQPHPYNQQLSNQPQPTTTQQPSQSNPPVYPNHSYPRALFPGTLPNTQMQQPSQSISPSVYNPTPGHLQFTNITQDCLDLTAPRPDLAGLNSQLNSASPETIMDPAQASHNPFASQQTTDLTGTSQATNPHSHAAASQPEKTFPTQPGMICPPPPPSDRITPSRVLDLTLNSKPKWFAFPFSRHHDQPAITKGVDWGLNTKGSAQAGLAQQFSTYAEALNYILTIFSSIPPAEHLCPNCMLRHLPVPCESPNYQWHTSIAWQTASACRKCHHQHFWGSPCSIAPLHNPL